MEVACRAAGLTSREASRAKLSTTLSRIISSSGEVVIVQGRKFQPSSDKLSH
jgi:hypothetical protein